jgi:hypothetical protein
VRQFCATGADFIICPSGGMFGPKTNDPIVQARSRENQIHITWILHVWADQDDLTIEDLL